MEMNELFSSVPFLSEPSANPSQKTASGHAQEPSRASVRMLEKCLSTKIFLSSWGIACNFSEYFLRSNRVPPPQTATQLLARKRLPPLGRRGEVKTCSHSTGPNSAARSDGTSRDFSHVGNRSLERYISISFRGVWYFTAGNPDVLSRFTFEVDVDIKKLGHVGGGSGRVTCRWRVG